MAINNYWWLLIWMFLGLFLGQLPKKRIMIKNHYEERWGTIEAALLVLPLIIWTGFRTTAWGDTGNYINMFKNLPNTLGEIGSYLGTVTKDEGFYFLSAIFKCVVSESSVVYLLIIGIIQLGILAYIYSKYSCDYWFSIFVFVASTDYMSWCHNGMRQFLAVCVVFLSTKWIIEKNYIPAVITVLLAATFHGSALLMLPIIFIIQGKAFNKKTVLCIIVAIGALVFIDQFTNVLEVMLSDTQYTNVVSDWQSGNDDGMNPIRVLVYSVPTLLAIMGYQIIKKEDNPVINMCVNASVVSTGIALVAMGTSGIFIGRLPIYCSLYATGILLPWEIKNLFTQSSSRMVYIIAIICYIAFFYYQMHFTWWLI